MHIRTENKYLRVSETRTFRLTDVNFRTPCDL